MSVKSKRWIKIRIYITGICLMLIFGVILLRAYQLQILEGDRLSSLAREGYTGRFPVTAQRGTIFDRNGKVLALSVDVDSIYCCPERIAKASEAASLLAGVLGMQREDVLKRLKSPGSFVWIKRKVSPDEMKGVRELALSGIGFIKESRRYYPCVETAAHVIGFASQDNEGLEGIELQYNRYLEGQRINLNKIRDAFGRPLTFDRAGMNRQGPFDLILTLDKEISYHAQKALRKAVERSGARSGVCIVMKPQTGEILAMAVVPEFNPNIFWRFKPYQWRNRAVTDCFEPGSTFKAFLLAAAIEGGVVTPETVCDCENGQYRIGSWTINDRRPFGILRVREIIKFSSNIGAIKIGQKLGAIRFHHYLRRFGFGERMGIDFPGERKGTLRPVEDTSLLGRNTLYFGQGVSVSPLQLAMAFGAIANGGRLMRPYLVKAIVDQSGRTIREFHPVVRRNIISYKTAQKVRDVLEGVVAREGTAPKAAIRGYDVAGKTGTAQKVDPITKTYSSRKFVAFFGGFAPASSPAVVILVALDEPEGKPSGGVVAGPVFREVGSWALNHLNVAPSVSVVAARNERTDERNPSYPTEKQERIVVRMSDAPGSIPDLKGLGVRDVLRRARKLGLQVVIKGSGLAVEQSPAPGTSLERHKPLTVTFRPPC
jgi:cell division protein FtsI (penicillin-binding protein 3)